MGTDKFTKANKKNGDILLGYRKQNKMTQLELGKLIGRDSREISKYETGVRAIPQAFVEILNKTLNLKLKNTGKVLKKNTITEWVKETPKVSKSKKVSLPSGKVITPKKSEKSSSVSKNTVKVSNFVKRLISFRESLNLSQKDFAKKYKFSVSSLNKLENGKSINISIDSLRALSKSISIDTLLR